MERVPVVFAPGVKPETRRAGASHERTERFPAEMELLEQRLEATLATGSGPDLFEPCVWHCACFLVHGN